MAYRAVHYLNQFFAGLGGEDRAGLPPEVQMKPLGPGLAFERLCPSVRIVGTVVCGDNYFAENEAEALERIVALVRECRPDLLVAGPAFGAGRYGVACVRVGQEVGARLNVPVLTGLHPDNPGMVLERTRVYVFPTGPSARDMEAALSCMAAFAAKLARGEAPGPAAEEGYLPRGIRRNVVLPETGAQRALAKLLAKLQGAAPETEVPLPQPKEPVAAVPPIDPSTAVIALVTEGSMVPLGNPDGLESAGATKWFKYSIAGYDRMPPGRYEAIHAGYFCGYVNEDPNRLVPVDVMREFERAGIVGRLHEEYYVTTGMITPVRNAERIGAEMVQDMRKEGVQAALVVAT
jgi:glycine reductase